MKILAIYDGGTKTLDRYTVVTDVTEGRWYNMLGLSANPTDYNGFSQWCNGQYHTAGGNPHLGKRVRFEDLSELLQRHIAQRVLSED